MSAGFPTVVIAASIAFGATNSGSDALSCSPGDQLTIRVTGELAEGYAQMASSGRLPATHHKNARLTIDGTVQSVVRNQIRMRHRVLIKRVGEVVRIMTLEATVNRKQISAVASEGTSSQKALHVELSEPSAAELRSVMLRGDFPASRVF